MKSCIRFEFIVCTTKSTADALLDYLFKTFRSKVKFGMTRVPEPNPLPEDIRDDFHTYVIKSENGIGEGRRHEARRICNAFIAGYRWVRFGCTS